MTIPICDCDIQWCPDRCKDPLLDKVKSRAVHSRTKQSSSLASVTRSAALDSANGGKSCVWSFGLSPHPWNPGVQTNSELASDETNYYLAYLYMIRAVRFCVRRLLGTIIFRDMEPMELSMGLPRGVELSIPMAGVGYTITYLMRYTLLILPSPQLRGVR